MKTLLIAMLIFAVYCLLFLFVEPVGKLAQSLLAGFGIYFLAENID